MLNSIHPMIEHKITTVILYCSKDQKFILKNIKNVIPFSHQVVIIYFSHLFNGNLENEDIIQETINEVNKLNKEKYNNNIDIIFQKVDIDINQSEFVNGLSKMRYYLCLGRWIGYNLVNSNTEYVLSLDCDEIAEPDKMIDWLNNFDYRKYNVLKLANYYYFRKSTYRLKEYEDGQLFVNIKFTKIFDLVFNEWEREAFYKYIPEPKIRQVLGIDNKPFFHHFSWFGEQDDFISKLDTWAHIGSEHENNIYVKKNGKMIFIKILIRYYKSDIIGYSIFDNKEQITLSEIKLKELEDIPKSNYEYYDAKSSVKESILEEFNSEYFRKKDLVNRDYEIIEHNDILF